MTAKIVNRYSDEDLEEFRILIENKIAEAKKAMEVYQEAYNGAGNDTNDTAPTFKNMEDGNQVLSKEETSAPSSSAISITSPSSGASLGESWAAWPGASASSSCWASSSAW